jgi:hypothetical protein
MSAALLSPTSHAVATSSKSRSRVLLRAASVIYVLFTLGHTIGGMLNDTHGGPRQAALFAAMRDYTVTVQGTTRSYWDFYRGFGFITSVLLALAAVLSWMLGDLGRTHPAQARRITVVLALAMAATTWLAITDFFPPQWIFALASTLLLFLAVLTLGRDARRLTSGGNAR